MSDTTKQVVVAGEVKLPDLDQERRNELHAKSLISDAEFEALLEDSENGQRVARLEGYDATKNELEEANRKGGELCSVLGNLLIHIHDLGLRKAPGTIYGDYGYANAALAECQRDRDAQRHYLMSIDVSQGSAEQFRDELLRQMDEFSDAALRAELSKGEKENASE